MRGRQQFARCFQHGTATRRKQSVGIAKGDMFSISTTTKSSHTNINRNIRSSHRDHLLKYQSKRQKQTIRTALLCESSNLRNALCVSSDSSCAWGGFNGDLMESEEDDGT